MSWFRRLLNLTRGDELSRDLDEELQYHIDRRADELVREGMSPDEARREARRRFGHVQKQKETTRDTDVLIWLESMMADVRYSLRSLRLSPGFTFVAILSIALGVGANTAIFSLINAVMLRTLPVPHAEELLRVGREDLNTESGRRELSSTLTNPLWEQIRDHQDAVDAFAFSVSSFNLANGGEVRRVNGSWVSGSYFPILGTRALAGRLIAPSDDVQSCPATVVVSPVFAAREYGSPEASIGKNLSLDGHPHTVIGVAEPGFSGLDVGTRVHVWLPVCAAAVRPDASGLLSGRSTWWLSVMARPKGTLTFDQVNARLAAVSHAINTATLPPDWPAKYQAEYMRSTLATEPAATGDSSVRASYREALLALMVVVGVVLLIACANVAHLLLARATARQREMALRMAIGAGRGRLVRQMLTESLLLATLGSVLGVVFARWASGLMVGLLQRRGTQVWLDLAIDGRVLAFTIGVAILTGMLFGLVPAWRASRVAPQSALQAQSRSVATGFTVTRGLVVGQFALSLVLLVAAGLLLRSFQKLASVDPGFDKSGVLLVSMDGDNAGLDAKTAWPVYRDVLERLRALPGVRAASASLVTPISGVGWNGDIEAEGFTPKNDRDGIVWFNGVSDGFFATMGTRRLAGRDFGPQDVIHGNRVAIVNTTMAQRIFHTDNPVGRSFRPRNGRGVGAPVEVIGVVQEAKYRNLKEKETPTAYLPLAQADLWGANMNFELRTDGNPSALIPAVRDVARQIHPAISIDFTTLSQQVAESMLRPRLLATLSAFFGALALLLATVGLYGTVSYSVARRRNEIGIRIALGAERSRVVRMILGEVARLLVMGAALGVAIALASTRLLSSFLFGLTPTDPATLTLSIVALGAVAIAAGALPAWRAARVDPMEALREE